MPGSCNEHDGVRVVLPRVFKYLQHQGINIQAGKIRDLHSHMEAIFLASDLLRKYVAFWL